MPSRNGRKGFMADQIHIQIVYVQEQQAIVKALPMAQGSRLGDALAAAGGAAEFSGVDLANAPVGIFGRLARKDQELKDGDRIEIYRPLKIEPKAARRARSRTAPQ
jgi:putative ubiquitin-RnfH superfamily antitoxin RatB of RatAB toxin-antitoxin module